MHPTQMLLNFYIYKYIYIYIYIYIKLSEYIYIYIYNEVPRSIRLDQARCFTGKRFEEFCTENNLEPIYAHANAIEQSGLLNFLFKKRKSSIKATTRKTCIYTKTKENQLKNLKYSI